MRIRSLKPEILTDEKTAGLSDREWRLFVSCIVMADDYGNFRASPAFLRTQVFWGIDTSLDEVAKARETLARVSLLSLYEVNGQSYGHVSGWAKHQRVDHPGKPLCPGAEQAIPAVCEESSREPRVNLARIRETLAPDQDQDKEQRPGQGTRSRPKRAAPAVGSPAFEAFWESFPAHRRVNKPKAVVAWPGDEHAPAIMAHVDSVKRKDGGEFIQQADRYLRNEMWKVPVFEKQQSLPCGTNPASRRADGRTDLPPPVTYPKL